MSQERVVYSIQKTYIINPVHKSEKHILTCDERIDIPTIEPLPSVQPVFYNGQPLTVIPCVELKMIDLSFEDVNLVFETNEGVTVLPIEIGPGINTPSENPYKYSRSVLVLPRGATGVKTCKITEKDTGIEIQHNFTFGIMPPPYNYDNALFGYYTGVFLQLHDGIKHLTVSNTPLNFAPAHLPKGEGTKTVRILPEELFFYVKFIYTSSPEPTIHKPIIALISDDDVFDYTLSLNKTNNTVLIDLFTGTITAYDSDNGETIQQFLIGEHHNTFKTLAFANFDDIGDTYLTVTPRGALLNV